MLAQRWQCTPAGILGAGPSKACLPHSSSCSELGLLISSLPASVEVMEEGAPERAGGQRGA